MEPHDIIAVVADRRQKADPALFGAAENVRYRVLRRQRARKRYDRRDRI